MNYSGRQRLLEHQLEHLRLDALLITHLANVRYLCGFAGSSGALAFANGEWAFFTDGRYIEQAKMQVKSAEVLINIMPPLDNAAQWTVMSLKRRKGAVRIGIEAEHITWAMQSRVASKLRTLGKSRYRLVQTREAVEQFRLRKDAEEIKQIRNAVQLASSVFPGVLHTIRAGATESEVAADLDHLARLAGAEKMSFDTIVASGANSALPHARPGRTRIGRGFVVLDYGVILSGCCSDMTRTVRVGRANEKARHVYSAVLEAQLAGIAAVRAGVEAHAVDDAARTVLRKRKLEKYFTHSLGHGVGIEIHESPRLAKGQRQKLEAGMVITIEPGVYIPGSGGVRIEDMVLVTKNGCEVLTPTSKELIIR
jgi:Xaa-Pro aminopeptidase